MIKEIKRRYFNIEILIWIMSGISVVLIMNTFYMNTLKRYTIGKPCAFDALSCMSQQFVFPLIMIITALCSQRMMKSDRDSMIILKYSSKQELYIKQVASTMCYSMAMTIIYMTSLILYARGYYGEMFNWNDADSIFRVSLKGMTMNNYIRPTKILIIYFLMMSLWAAITCNIGILINIIFSSDSVAGLVITALGGIDMFIPIFYHKFLLFETSWYNMSQCENGIMCLVIIFNIIFIIGYIMQGRKEYYEYKNEDE